MGISGKLKEKSSPTYREVNDLTGLGGYFSRVIRFLSTNRGVFK